MTEEWREVPGHEGYEASNLGRIRSRWIRGGAHSRGRQLGQEWRLLDGWVNVWGYRQVNLIHGDSSVTRPVHQVVAEAFHGPRPAPEWELRHLDGDKLNNRPRNLAWGTQSQNVLDRVRHGTHHNAIKTHCKRGHAFDEFNTYVLPRSGSRVCRACVRARRGSQPDPRGENRDPYATHARESLG